MKKLIFLAFLTVVMSACNKKAELSGEVANHSVKVAAFTVVTNNSSGNIELDSSVGLNEVLITGDQALVDNLVINDDKGQLTISNKKSIAYNVNNSPLVIKINNPNLEKVVIAGAGSLATNNITFVNDVDFHMSGAGEINAKVFNNTTTVFLTGAGNVRLSGSSNNIKANISGAGTLNARDLSNKVASVEISGTGSANINTSEEINVTISGVGNLDYKNHQGLKIVKKVTGIGSIDAY